ncbi:MAG: helix-turn-helix domain-containing protein [Abditibacteriaceae bacterium]
MQPLIRLRLGKMRYFSFPPTSSKRKEVMSHDHHLTQEQRYHIECCAKRGVKQNQIAQDIGVHPSTVSRELKLYGGRCGYRQKYF